MLPYLEVNKTNKEEAIINQVEMPEVTGMSIEDAKKILIEQGLDVEINGEQVQENVVIDQLPKKGIKINLGTKVTIYVQ